MPSSRRGGPPGPDPHLLFNALLTRNGAWAAQLLLGTQAQQLSHEAPAGFSSLHAAVVGGCAGQLLALVAAGGLTLRSPAGRAALHFCAPGHHSPTLCMQART